MKRIYTLAIAFVAVVSLAVVLVACQSDEPKSNTEPLTPPQELITYDELYAQSMDCVFEYLVKANKSSRSGGINNVSQDEINAVLRGFFESKGEAYLVIYEKLNLNTRSINDEYISAAQRKYMEQLHDLRRLIRPDDLKRAVERIEKSVINDSSLSEEDRGILLVTIYTGKAAIKYWKEDNGLRKWIYEFSENNNQYNLTRLEKYSKQEREGGYYCWGDIWDATVEGAKKGAGLGATIGGTVGSVVGPEGTLIMGGGFAIGGGIIGGGIGAITEAIDQDIAKGRI